MKKKEKKTDTWIISKQTQLSGGGKKLISVKMAITSQRTKTKIFLFMDTSEYPTRHEYRTLLCMSAIY